MTSPGKFFITTAIDYTNAAPHIGHAYEKVLADTLARYHRLKGDPTYYLTGVDQHGTKVKQAAEKEGIAPREFADRVTAKFLSLWETLGISRDGWASTTDLRHIRAVQSILQSLYDKGELYKARHEGFYSVRQEQFLTEKERGPDGNFGPEWGEVVRIEEENWYFKLASHRDWLLGFLQSHGDFVTPAFRRSELVNAVEKIGGDLCISRPKERLSWGIEIPFDPGFVTYVWFDALINYISFAGYPACGDGSLPDFATLWPCDAHVIGKDILVPAHGIYWPIMLHAMGFADDQMPRLLVHGWWNIGGAKMSKSLGNSVDPAVLADKYGPDALRYYLLRDIATGQDADFSEERLRIRYNSELANDTGNLLNRTLNMAARYRGGKLRRLPASDPAGATLDESACRVAGEYVAAMDAFQPQAALESVAHLVSEANGYVETSAPWKLAKDPAASDRLDAVLYRLAETLRLVGVLLLPALPRAAEGLFGQLCWTPPADMVLHDLVKSVLPDGHTLGAPVPLFPRIEMQEIIP